MSHFDTFPRLCNSANEPITGGADRRRNARAGAIGSHRARFFFVPEQVRDRHRSGPYNPPTAAGPCVHAHGSTRCEWGTTPARITFQPVPDHQCTMWLQLNAPAVRARRLIVSVQAVSNSSGDKSGGSAARPRVSNGNLVVRISKCPDLCRYFTTARGAIYNRRSCWRSALGGPEGSDQIGRYLGRCDRRGHIILLLGRCVIASLTN